MHTLHRIAIKAMAEKLVKKIQSRKNCLVRTERSRAERAAGAAAQAGPEAAAAARAAAAAAKQQQQQKQ